MDRVVRFPRRLPPAAPVLLAMALGLSSQAYAYVSPTYGQSQVTCAGSLTASVSGTVQAPNGVDPLPNIVVYIPESAPSAFTDGVTGVTNDNAATLVTGGIVVQTTTATNGTFTLTNVPVGTDIPLVIQAGRWRRQLTITATTNACSTTALTTSNVRGSLSTDASTDGLVRFPQTQLEGDIPKIALVSGKADALECTLRKIGIADTEFTNYTTDISGGSHPGRINLFTGVGNAGAEINSSTSTESTLMGSATTPYSSSVPLSGYNVLMLPCQSDSTSYPTTDDQSNFKTFVDDGGRAFVTHLEGNYLNGNYPAAATWDVGVENTLSPDPDTTATINTGFSVGSTLANWLYDLFPTSTLGEVTISTLRLDQTAVNSPAQTWVNFSGTSDSVTHPAMQFSFYAPWGNTAATQYGRVLFNEYHVDNASVSSASTASSGGGNPGNQFPYECVNDSHSDRALATGSAAQSPTTNMSAQEHMLEYSLFDLMNFAVPVVAPTVSISLGGATSFTGGDNGYDITVTVENTSGTAAIGTAPAVNLTVVLPAGLTAQSMTDSAGIYSCTASLLSCTLTSPWGTSVSDTITMTVAAAANVTANPSASISATVASAGFSSNVTSPVTVAVTAAPAESATWSGSSGVPAGTVPVGSTVPVTATFAISAATTIGSVSVLTQGATGLDFTESSSTCVATFASASTCTVSVNFVPAYPGLRIGAVEIFNGGTLLATQYLYGIGTAPQIIFSNGAATTLPIFYISPFTLRVTANGSIYEADAVDHGVILDPQGCATSSCTTLMGSGLWQLRQILVDGAGNVYAASAYGTVTKIPPGCASSSCQTNLGAGFSAAWGVTMDTSQNLFVSDESAGKVYELPASDNYTTKVTLVTGLSQPTALTMDQNNNLFVATYSGATVTEYTQSSGYATGATVASGLAGVWDMSMDAAGNLFVTDTGHNAIKMFYPPNGNSTGVIVHGSITGPMSVSTAQNGNLYVLANTGYMYKLDFVDPPSFSYSSTGVGSTTAPASPLTVSNDGNEILTFTSAGLTAPTDYVAATGTTCADSGTLASNATCELNIDFAPLSAGMLNESFVLTDNNLNVTAATQSIPLSGTATAPLTAQTITFANPGMQTVGTPLTLSASSTSGLTVSFASATSSVCTVSGSTVSFIASGTCTIDANQAGNSTYAAATQVAQSFTVNGEAQTITFSNPGMQTVGTPLTLSASSTSGLTIVFTSTTSSVCTVSGSAVTFIASGTCTIDANQGGNSTYAAATQVAQSFTVNGEAQTVTFSNPGTQTVGTPLTLSASSTSELTVTFVSATPSICTVSGSTVTFIASGTCTIDANQAGNSTYAAATQVAQSFTVNGEAQTVTFANPGMQTVGTPLTLSASSTSELTVTFVSATPSICTVSGSTVTLIASGTCTIDANQAGNSNYAAATQVAQSFTVNGEAQTVTLSNPGTQTVGTPLTLFASSTSELTVIFTSATPSICTVTGGLVTFIAQGTCTIDANQAGNSTYAAATQVAQSFTVNGEAQTITFSNPGMQTVGTPLTLSASSTSGLTISFTSATPSVCMVTGGLVTFIAQGTCTIDANQAGNSTYAAATQVAQSFTVNGEAQTITFSNPGMQTVGTPLTLSASSTSGLTVIFTSATPSICRVTGGLVTFIAQGTCTIDANQAGNGTYAPTTAAQSFTVSTASGASLNFNVTGLAFGNQPVGSTSPAQTVILSNPNAFPAILSGVTASGDFAATSSCSTIAAGDNCSVNVTFTPSVAGARTGVLTVTGAQGFTPQSIQLTGTGTAAGIQVAPTALSFGSQVLATTSGGQTITILNTGTANLTISNLDASDDFAVSGDCANVPAGSNCSLTVTFTPTASGARAGTLTFSDSVGGQSEVINLSGTGTVAGAALTPTALTFPGTLVGGNSFSVNTTLTNTGTAALTSLAVSIVGDFKQTNTCPSSLAVSASCAISVTYAPTIVGAESGTVTVSDNLGTQAASLLGTGLAPGASLSTAQLAFGGQLVGTSSLAQTVVFTNSGSAAVNITSVVSSANFTDTTNCSAVIAAGASCSVNIFFEPAGTGSLNGTVTITDDAGAQVVTTRGEGVSPGLAIAPSFAIFGAQQTGTPSQAQTLTASNTGTAPLTLKPITVSSSNFSESDQCPAVLNPRASCLISVSFTPAATGTLSGSLVVSDTSESVSTLVTLSGSGTLPGLTTSPSTVSFGSLPVGTASQAQTVTVSNTGTAPLQIGAITGSGDFAETDTCTSATIAAGSYCVINVTMTPTTMGSRTGTIQINNNADGAQLIALSGVGQQAGVSVSPTSLAFGSLPFVSSSQVGATAGTALSVTITNTGNAPITLNGFSTQGDFAESNNCGSTVAAGATCVLTVTFVPTALGQRTGTLTITDNAGGGTQVVSLAGDGSPAGLVLTPPVLNFGVQTKGVSSQRKTATLSNNTGEAITDLKIAASGEYSESDNCGGLLANGATCNLSITVTPATTGAITGSVTVSTGGSISTGASSGRIRPETADGATGSYLGVVAMTASAVPPGISLSIPELSFSITSVGQPGTGQTLTLRNTGTSLSLTHLTIGETDGTDFPFTTTCPATLAPQAACTITIMFTPTGTGLRAGIMNITADGGISAAVPESGVAAKGTPAAAVSASPNPVLLQSAVTFTATISSAEVMPTGTVTFMDGTMQLGSSALSAGVAKFTTSSLAAGSHSITTVYSGDTNFNAAVSSPLSQTVIDFALNSVGSATQTTPPGKTVAYSFAIVPTSGQQFPTPTTLTVSGLPAGATATIASSTWTQLTGTSWSLPASTQLTNIVMTVQVARATASLGEKEHPAREVPPALWGILLLPFAGRVRRAGKQIGRSASLLLLLAASAAAMAGLGGCAAGNGFFGQQQQTYTLSVTATTGTLSHSADVTLTVP